MLLAIILIFILAGFILSIRFFESWLKFRAEGVPVPSALSFGKLVFTNLNRIELGFVVLIAVSVLATKGTTVVWPLPLLLGAIGVLLFQKFWLLPGLNLGAIAKINRTATAP